MPTSSSLDLARARIDTGQVRVRDPGTVLGRRCRAVSLHRPWANLVVSGHQPVGAQSWSTAYRGLLVIHGGSQWDLAGSVLAAELGLTPALDVARCPAGHLGTVQLDGIHASRACCRPWAGPSTGAYHWVFRDPCVFTTPVPGRGQGRIFWSERR